MADKYVTQQAHEFIGGFLARCSLLEYRASQFIASWFCTSEKQKFLSYTLQGMDIRTKSIVILQRLTDWHDSPHDVRDLIEESSRVFERRELVRNGLLSQRSSGTFCIKSYSAMQFLSGPDEVDIIDVDELPQWSEKASELSEKMVSLSHKLKV